MDTSPFGIDDHVFRALLESTEAGLSMADIRPAATGVSRMYATSHAYTILVGLVGESNGSLSISLSEAALVHIAERMLGEQRPELDEVVLDCGMEVANIVAGDLKTRLVDTPHAIHHISLPSVIFGGQHMYFSRGMDTCAITFELPQMPVKHFNARMFSATLSLLRAAGR